MLLRVRSRIGDVEELVRRAKALCEGAVVQLLNPDSIISERQVLHAIYLARRAFEEGRNLARTIENEFLLRVAATRQMRKAIDRVGIKNPENFLIFMDNIDKEKVMKELEAEELPMKLGKEASIAKMYGIEKELLTHYTIEDIILERMALIE